MERYIEPFKVKVVEPITAITREQRAAAGVLHYQPC